MQLGVSTQPVVQSRIRNVCAHVSAQATLLHPKEKEKKKKGSDRPAWIAGLLVRVLSSSKGRNGCRSLKRRSTLPLLTKHGPLGGKKIPNPIAPGPKKGPLSGRSVSNGTGTSSSCTEATHMYIVSLPFSFSLSLTASLLSFLFAPPPSPAFH